MSHRARRRRRRRAALPPGGSLHLALSLPALLGIRWLFITATTATAMGAYALVLLTAAPMPPTQPPPAVATGHR